MAAKNYHFFVWLSIVFCLRVNAAPPQKIIGGEESEENEFPYLVSLRKVWDGSHFCGGSILDENHILTAAHCVAGAIYPSDVIVVVGSNKISSGGIGHTAKKIFIPRKFRFPLDRLYKLYDVAIVVLATPLNPNNTNWQPIKLTTHRYPAGTSAVFAGWGEKKCKEKTDKLMKLHTTLASINECEKQFLDILDYYHICILPINGTSGCYGDSGGPLVVGEELVGVVSYGGKHCNTVSIFSDVVEYRDTIDDLLQCEVAHEKCVLPSIDFDKPQEEDSSLEEEDPECKVEYSSNEEEDSEINGVIPLNEYPPINEEFFN